MPILREEKHMVICNSSLLEINVIFFLYLFLVRFTHRLNLIFCEMRKNKKTTAAYFLNLNNLRINYTYNVNFMIFIFNKFKGKEEKQNCLLLDLFFAYCLPPLAAFDKRL